MKMIKRRTIFLLLLSVAALLLLLPLIHVIVTNSILKSLGLDKSTLLYHNQCIQQGLSAAKQITFTDESAEPRSTPQTVTVTDPDEMRLILSCLNIDDLEQPLGVQIHCRANIAIRIKTTAADYSISYILGEKITPISQGNNAVYFIKLNQTSCAKLNKFLLSKGFSESLILGCY